ncbi:hypothetical protein M422DRAFT_239023 [Sphaerobolus stellatus SS14]|nr:hypothetical protein M422DRAFT_239023 [Sphaerobolus stellatus SS14]
MIFVRIVLKKKPSTVPPLDGDAWIFDAMRVAKTAASASKLVPVVGSSIEGGANLFNDALELLKQMKKNKEDFKGLSEDIATLLQTFSAAIKGRASDSLAYPPEFIYETLSKDIGLLITDLKSKRVKTYIRTEQIRDTISKYQGEIQTLRDNLMLYCNLSNTVQLFEVDRRVTSLVRERDMSVDEDFPEPTRLSDIILKENTGVELRGKDKSPSFIEYRAVALFNGREYLTTTRTYEGESALERLKAELKLLARILEYDFRDVVKDPELDSLEPDEWEARTRTVKGLWLNFMPSHAEKIKPLCITVNTRRKRELELWQINELNRDSLLAQFSHIAGRLKDCFQGNFNDLKLGLALVTGFYWYIKVWKPVKRANTSAVPDLYLFIDEPVIHKGAGRRGPDVYWSKCPDGTIRLTALEVYALGIERAPVIWCEPKYIQWNLEIVDMLRDFYESCGLSPCSDEVSHLLELPVPDYPEPKQIKRRHSFAGLHQLKSSTQDEIRKVDKIDVYSWFWEDFNGEMISLLPWVSSYISEEYRLFQEFNQRLGTRVAKYWVFLAAPELLPESLKVYDLRTTGHEFEYGGVGIDPVCRELPSRHWNFMKGDRWGEYDEQLSKLKCSLSM